MPHFLPKVVTKIPELLLAIFKEPYTPESEKPVLSKRAIALLASIGIFMFFALCFFVSPSEKTQKFFEIFFFGLSAFLWFAAATIPSPLPMAYASGAPDKVIRRAYVQTLCNQCGAICTAIGLIIQTV